MYTLKHAQTRMKLKSCTHQIYNGMMIQTLTMSNVSDNQSEQVNMYHKLQQ